MHEHFPLWSYPWMVAQLKVQRQHNQKGHNGMT